MFRQVLGFLLSLILLGVFALGSPASTLPHASPDMWGDAPPDVERISGPNRYGTSEAIARKWSGPVDVVYVVSGENYPDALSAGARAGRAEAPVVLVHPNRVPTETKRALQHLSPAKIVIVGGDSAVAPNVSRALARYASTGEVRRIAGSNRYRTNARLFRGYAPGANRVYLASGENFPDALAVAALAGHEGAPLLLTKRDTLDSSVAARLEALGAKEVVVIGDVAAVSTAVAREAASHTGRATFTRIAGENRYETAAKVADRFGSGVDTAYVASGLNYPDALVGAALAARAGGPMLLTTKRKIHPATATALKRAAPSAVRVLGGPAVLTGAVMRELQATPDWGGLQCQNPLPTGTTFGASVYTTGQPADEAVARVDSQFGRVPILRSFSSAMPHPWDSRHGRALSGRDVVSSFKALPKEVLAGKHDASLLDWFQDVPESHAVYWSYYHEPESEIRDGLFTASDYRAAWKHIKLLEETVCKPDLHSTLILTEWTAHPNSGRQLSTYDAGPRYVEVLSFDPYNGVHDSGRTYYVEPAKLLDHVVAFAKAGNRPFAIAEIGSRLAPGDDGRERARWLSNIGAYLIEHDAVYVTYFQARVGADWRLDEPRSQQAWARLIANTRGG